MKILVVNGSPHGAEGNTQILVDAFLGGAIEAGAQAETVFLTEKNIEHCGGCFTCWFGTPGKCVHDDDMPALLEKVQAADCVVFATPLYVYTVSGLMKDFMDRIIPLAQPFMTDGNGVTTHPARVERKTPQTVVVISNCGFPETDHFSGMKETFRCWFRASTREPAGMICCAAGPMLHAPEARPMVQWYLDATRKAGAEVVEQGKIAPETAAILDRSLAPDPAWYRTMLNERFHALVG